MATIKQFDFESVNKIDDEVNEVKFTAKGYIEEKEEKILYFKSGSDAYKFFIKDRVIVYVNDSKYEFDLNKKTLAYIESNNFSMQASIDTKTLEITDNKLLIEYILDFNSFKGEYKIILNWH